MPNSQFAYDNFDCGIGLDQDSINTHSGKHVGECRTKSARRKLFTDKHSILCKSKIVISSGFSKINKLFSNLKNKIGSTSQNFRLKTFRRYELNEYDSNFTPQTPSRRVHNILGRTPIKLYSPFGIETPVHLK